MNGEIPLLNSHGDKIWCPLYQEYVRFIKIKTAAEVADVNPRTIYRYIEEGKIQSLKIAGTTQRVCSSCLLRSD